MALVVVDVAAVVGLDDRKAAVGRVIDEFDGRAMIGALVAVQHPVEPLMAVVAVLVVAVFDAMVDTWMMAAVIVDVMVVDVERIVDALLAVVD